MVGGQCGRMAGGQGGRGTVWEKGRVVGGQYGRMAGGQGGRGTVWENGRREGW